MAAKQQPDPNQTGDANGRVLREETNEVYSLKIEIDAEEYECRVSLAPKGKGSFLTPQALTDILQDSGVRAGLLPGAIAAFCQVACQGRNQEQVLLAEGTRPVAGPDGYVEFYTRVSSKEILLGAEDDSGTIDLRSLNFFSNVVPDDPIGLLHPPKNGEPGLTVTGLPGRPLLGKPLTVVAGAGVRVEQEGCKFIAETPGRVVYESSTIAVSEEYSVSGDVNFEVGSIRFLGVVDVRGDVLDEFDISATKGLTVSGAVGACQIESAGNIILGSMSGKGSGTIKCGGDLVARFLNDVTVECEGNVIVGSEIRNSVIKAGGYISVENGQIFGGKCVALAGIEGKILGSYLGVRTKLTSGAYFRELDRLKYLQQRQQSVHEQIKRISDTLGPLQHSTANTALAEAIKKRIEVLGARLEELTRENEAVVAELATAKPQPRAAAEARINVRSALEEGVVLCLGEVVEDVRVGLSGPLSITVNADGDGLSFDALAPLRAKSRPPGPGR
ncbi:MAG: DUF342 domain-containing protein [Trichloromonadaceae bacterium]